MTDREPALLSFEVPGEPQGKGRPRAGKGFGGFTTLRTPDKTRSYEAMVQVHAQQAGARPLEGPLWVHITAFFRAPKNLTRAERAKLAGGQWWACKTPDCDNVAKIVCDALNAVAYRDDAQVVHLAVVKRYAEVPRVVVSIGKMVDTPHGTA